MTRPRDLNTPWAQLLVDRLAAGGVRHAVVSPGSRSTPLVLAASRQAGLDVHTLVDERTAAFFALGQARVTAAPVLLVCTSGTAAAHWLPALVEASESGLPLIALTADRPPELQHRAAPQATDQVKLFGPHVRRYFELGLPDDDPRALEGLAATVALALATARAPSAGPVHLNAWFRKPLEPQTPGDDDDAYRAAVDALRARPPLRRFPPQRAPHPAAIAEIAAHCRAAPRGAIVCGPAPLERGSALRPFIARLAAATGYPVFAEATSQFRFTGAAEPARIDFFDPLLRSRFGASHAPGIVLQIGSPPVSKAIEQFVEQNPALVRWVLADHGWNEPFNRAAGIVAASLDLTLSALAAALEPGTAADPGWRAEWRAADDALRAAVAATWDAGWSEPAAIRRIVAGLPADGLLVLANSLPVREADLFCPGSAASCGVLCQRGVNGIDGLVAGAAGSASVARRPVTLIVGDVAFQHDVGGLAALAGLGAPLTVVVVDNGGGRLFELLPLADDPNLRAPFEACFLAPPSVNAELAARAFGLPAATIVGADGLANALAAPADGPRVLRVVVPGERTRADHARLRALADSVAPA